MVSPLSSSRVFSNSPAAGAAFSKSRRAVADFAESRAGVRQRLAQRSRRAGIAAATRFDLYGDAPASPVKRQIDLGAGRRAPDISMYYRLTILLQCNTIQP